MFDSGRGLYTDGCDLHAVCMRAAANGMHASKAPMMIDATVNGYHCVPCGSM